MREVHFHPEFAAWRSVARQLLAEDARPEELFWAPAGDGQSTLFADASPSTAPNSGATPKVPKAFLEIAEFAACHRDPRRWDLLYRVLYRLTHGEPKLLEIDCDPDIAALYEFRKAVGRDMHKMRAFVRFRKSADNNYIAWHRPDHHIVEANAPFFVRRFGSMPFAILTPDKSAYWDLELLRFGPGVPRSEALETDADALEDLWLAYYASIFNPARVKVKAMKTEMPVRHWPTLPETALIPGLLAQASARVTEMAKKQPDSAARFVPASSSLPMLAEASKGCQGCPLFQFATQTVFGEGPENARVVLVGEQPGDSEDRAGHPFVGPAGRLLDQALEEAGVDRGAVYITNAVKHFKFIERGKRRLHQKPGGIEISACRPWLEAEVSAIQPSLIVCMGGTAAQSVMGRAVKVLTERGKLVPHHWARQALITIHPSAILRAPDEALKAAQYQAFVEDLRMIPQALNGSLPAETLN
jgi:DNA polymerase